MLRWGLDFRRERRMVVARNCLIPSCSMANEVCIETDIVANRYDMMLMGKLWCMSWIYDDPSIAQLIETTYLPIIFTDESGSGSLGLPGFDETHNLKVRRWCREGNHNCGCYDVVPRWNLWCEIIRSLSYLLLLRNWATSLLLGADIVSGSELACAICRGRRRILGLLEILQMRIWVIWSWYWS